MSLFPFEVHTIAAGAGESPPRLALTRAAADQALDAAIASLDRRPGAVVLVETAGTPARPIKVETWSLNCKTAADHAAVRAARSIAGRRRRRRSCFFRP